MAEKKTTKKKTVKKEAVEKKAVKVDNKVEYVVKKNAKGFLYLTKK